MVAGEMKDKQSNPETQYLGLLALPWCVFSGSEYRFGSLMLKKSTLIGAEFSTSL